MKKKIYNFIEGVKRELLPNLYKEEQIKGGNLLTSIEMPKLNPIFQYIANCIEESDGVLTEKEMLIYNIVTESLTGVEKVCAIEQIMYIDKPKYNCFKCDLKKRRWICNCGYNQYIIKWLKTKEE